MALRLQAAGKAQHETSAPSVQEAPAIKRYDEIVHRADLLLQPTEAEGIRLLLEEKQGSTSG